MNLSSKLANHVLKFITNPFHLGKTPSIAETKVSHARVLFLLKNRTFNYGEYTYNNGVSGMFHSVRFMHKMLSDLGVTCKFVEVTDNNDIDREVFAFKPTHAIIEGLWVVPEKFNILQKLHPKVKWIIRIHSNIPFLSNEGVAIKWIVKYLKQENVLVGCNSDLARRDLARALAAHFPNWGVRHFNHKLVYLPNYYPEHFKVPSIKYNEPVLNVACFGAIRPLKNQLIQAIAAIEYANSANKKLIFHINHDRQEQGGNNNFQNIEGLFVGSTHKLVCHPWMEHNKFLTLLSTMDLSMCVSFSETFCIVAADSVAAGIPLVTSNEVCWSVKESQAEPTNLISILKSMSVVLNPNNQIGLTKKNQKGIKLYNELSKKRWINFLDSCAIN